MKLVSILLVSTLFVAFNKCVDADECTECWPGTSGQCQAANTVCYSYQNAKKKSCHPSTSPCVTSDSGPALTPAPGATGNEECTGCGYGTSGQCMNEDSTQCYAYQIASTKSCYAGTTPCSELNTPTTPSPVTSSTGDSGSGPLDSCSEQKDCSSISVTQVSDGPSCGTYPSSTCQYQVCMTLDTTANGGCSKTSTISHFCDMSNDSSSCSTPGLWGSNSETYDNSQPLVNCQYAGGNQEVVFLMKDGGSCANSVAEFDLSGGGTASCGPTANSDLPTCTGNGVGKECRWTITTPPCPEVSTPAPVAAITQAPVAAPTPAPFLHTPSPADPSDCEPNLGSKLSQGTDTVGNQSLQTYPKIHNGAWKRSDDSVSLLVGGNYYGISGAEIEGKIVCLGTFKISGSGPSDLVEAGVGSRIVPNDGDVILVGKDLEIMKTVRVMELGGAGSGNIVYKGSDQSTGTINTFGSVTEDSSLDLSYYSSALSFLQTKSAFWAGLSANGGSASYQYGWKFSASDNECIQVMNVQASNLGGGNWVSFDSSLSGRTIIINVIDSGDVQLTGIADMEDCSGNRAYSFDPNLTRNILWNFPSATSVTLDGGAEFQGSILIPNGDLIFKHPGHSGRVIVNGDLTQNYGGSEFHNYPFDPTCSLPLPGGSACNPTPSPVTPTEAPVTPTEAPVTPTEAPVTPTEAPVTPTEAPVTPTEAPVTPTEAPVTPTEAPVTPTEAPVSGTPRSNICGMEMGETGDTICPEDADVVKLIAAVGASPPDGQSIIYNLEFLAGTEISFKVNNPFESTADIYVQYDDKISSGSFLDSKCVEDVDVPGCNPDNASTITAGCLTPPGHPAFSIVTIFFVSNDSYLGSGGATVEQCCHENPDTIDTPVVEYVFHIQCECPAASNARNLRGTFL